MVTHIDISLTPQRRGFHLITREVVDQLNKLPESGILNLFIKHTSAGLTINENADPSVRYDFEQIFNDIVREDLPYITHDMEGPDDMPAHIKAAMVGSSVTIPIRKGRLDMGTWQGIYLCEFRNHGGSRKLIASIYT